MDLSDLSVYKAFYEFRHLSEVASRCNVAQPTISYRLKKIQDELGVRLYRFDGKYRFTENGIRFYEFCDATLSSYEGFLATTVSQDEIHVSLSSVATIYYMETLYDLLKSDGRYPVISTTSSAEAIRNVADGTSELAIVGGVQNTKLPSALAKRRLYHEEIVLVYNAKLPDDIQFIPILLDDRESGLNPLTIEYLKQFPKYRIAGEIGKPFEKLNLAATQPIGVFVPAEYRRYVHTNHTDQLRISERYSFSRDLFVVYDTDRNEELAAEVIKKIDTTVSRIQ
jgi:DNA-binding transcriptional LysR family regulator